MRRRARLSLGLATTFVSVMLLGGSASDSTKEADDGLDVYFRSAELLALTDQELPEYPSDEAGDSTLLGRDFPDAPPQISHEIENMYPITAEDNECLECHLPKNAAKGDIPLPDSHFMEAVMGKGGASDPMVWVVKDYKKIKQIVGERYNCNMCHTPQATNVETSVSTFESARKGK